MGTDLPLLRHAAKGLVRALREGDRAAVVAVNTSVTFPRRFTADHESVEAAIDALATSGLTAIYDALYIALKEFARERRQRSEVRRQVLVLLSDGLDNASHVSADDVEDQARRAGVSIYVIALKGTSLSGAPRDLEARRAGYAMRAIALDSGGWIFYPTNAAELPDIYGAIARELASQYELGYVPTKPGGDGAFRRITVRVLPPRSAVARTRSGYYAARSSGQIHAGTPPR
jgi:Ca-activated chloride channel family protein